MYLICFIFSRAGISASYRYIYCCTCRVGLLFGSSPCRATVCKEDSTGGLGLDSTPRLLFGSRIESTTASLHSIPRSEMRGLSDKDEVLWWALASIWLVRPLVRPLVRSPRVPSFRPPPPRALLGVGIPTGSRYILCTLSRD